MKRLLLWAAVLFCATWLQAAAPTVKEAVQPFIDSGEMNGAVSLIWTDGQLQIDCMGWADAEKKIPISEKNLFWIASMTKAFTGASIMMLVDEGKLSLDDPVEKYLPEFKNVKVAVPNDDGTVTLRAPASKMTIRQTLSHTAGFPFLTPQQAQFGIDVFPMRQLASTAASHPLQSDPGTRYQYSNVGINVASAILEIVSGQSLENFFQSRIFDPLEMKDTTFHPTKEQIAQIAQCFRVETGKPCVPTKVPYLQTPYDSPKRFAEAGGGLFSTPADVMKFYQMLAGKGLWNGKRLLSEKAMETLCQKHTPESLPNNYGLGMGISSDWFGHGGALQTNAMANFRTNQAWCWFVQIQGHSKCAEEWRKALAEILK